MQLSLERGGRFVALRMRPNAHKCAAMRTKVYQYFVRVEATDEKLTAEGFVINNEEVQNYFDARFGRRAPEWDAMSCEMLALTAAREMCAKLLSEGIVVHSVLCRIKGSNGAWIEARCLPNEVN